jgi:hypothetical protein
VFFPYREGDAVDVFLDVRLRQTTDLGGDTQLAARELDEEQLNRIARRIVEHVASSPLQSARVGVRFASKSR